MDEIPPNPALPTGDLPSEADYDYIREIDRGGYGYVYLFRRKKALEGQEEAYCAGKFVYRHMFGPPDDGPSTEAYERAYHGLQNFQSLAGCSQDLLRILHVRQRHEEGYFCYMMELADDIKSGRQIDPSVYQPRTLKWELERDGSRQRLPAIQCVEIAISLARGLQVLHENGFTHRDVRPANIIFVNGVPKLADIDLLAGSDVTRTSYIPQNYAAPEGSHSKRADIFSLGKTLYEICTGLRPESFPALPPDVRSWEDHKLVLKLNRVITKACARDLRKRYQSATEMRADLELLTPGQSPKHRVKPRQTWLRSPLFKTVAVATPLLLALACWKWGLQPALTQRESPQTQHARLPASTKASPWINSLGMKFVPVPGTKVLFSIWDTRVQDFKVFAESVGSDTNHRTGVLKHDGWGQREGYSWRNPGFTQGPTHPVCGVSWKDAQAFCRWLTERERKTGLITTNQRYRLPTDEEWSIAAGLTYELGSTPTEKDAQNKGVFPWGMGWPPPAGAGNFAGAEAKDMDWPDEFKTIAGYRDDYPRTSPVGSFAPNPLGLYDMSGNVCQWCEDWGNKKHYDHVLRGGSWFNYQPDRLYSSQRFHGSMNFHLVMYGFRCVLAENPR
jgi:formylglycine-generating enzyme required for sulfatase activity